ncbi:MAG: branched-chain amino acid ABC transporter permease, partial [Burkholderiales bacterium]|nr:branched-chain amino acid ABC transporter permease [Burkholderiales bacterium]
MIAGSGTPSPQPSPAGGRGSQADAGPGGFAPAGGRGGQVGAGPGGFAPAPAGGRGGQVGVGPAVFTPSPPRGEGGGEGSATAVPKAAFDWQPIALLAALVALGLPLIGSASTWLTLTVAGLAMGMIIFIVASGLTLVFGLMDVLNFGHGVFIALGAYIATSVFAGMSGWTGSATLWRDLVPLFAAMALAMLAAGAVGWAFERVLVRPVYGQHLKQILVTMGGMIIGEELIKMIWGTTPIAVEMPQALRGVVTFGDSAVEKYRLLATALGAGVFVAMLYTLNRTKLGLLIRAGVQDREMVESLGYRIRRLFLGVFMVGAALAGLGGVMWGLYREQVHASIG